MLHPDALAMGYAAETLERRAFRPSPQGTGGDGKAAEVSAGAGRTGWFAVSSPRPWIKKGDPVGPVRDEMIRLVEDFANNPPSAAEMERTRIRLLPIPTSAP